MRISLNALEHIPFKALDAVAEWQNYGAGVKSVSSALAKALPNFPTATKTYAGDLYRVIGLNKKAVKAMLLNKEIPARPLEGWTKTKANAEEYLGSLGQLVQDDAIIVAMFKFKAKGSDVVLDLEKFHNNKLVKSSEEYWSEKGKYLSEGWEFGDSQKEVVVARPTLKFQEILELIDTKRVRHKNGFEDILKSALESN